MGKQRSKGEGAKKKGKEEMRTSKSKEAEKQAGKEGKEKRRKAKKQGNRNRTKEAEKQNNIDMFGTQAACLFGFCQKRWQVDKNCFMDIRGYNSSAIGHIVGS